MEEDGICKQSTLFQRKQFFLLRLYITSALTLSPSQLLPLFFSFFFLPISSELKDGGRRRHQHLVFLLFLPAAASVRRDQPLRRLQDSAPPLRRQMCSGALFPSTRSAQVHHCSSRLRRQQHNQVLAGMFTCCSIKCLFHFFPGFTHFGQAFGNSILFFNSSFRVYLCNVFPGKAPWVHGGGFGKRPTLGRSP